MLKPLIFAYLLFSVGQVFGQKNNGVIIFENANVIDGISQKPLNDVSVTIENGKIVNIHSRPGKTPAGATVIDLQGKWLLPGFVDAHVHIEGRRAHVALLSGVTTARTMASGRFQDVGMRDSHRAGDQDLPDIVAAGYQVRPDMPPGFYLDFPELRSLGPKVTGVENVRKIVRALIAKKVDVIKLLATERAGTPETDPLKQTFTDEEIAAIVDEAKKAGIPVAAHAHGDEGAYAAVKAGVRSIEHGTFLSEKTLRLMKTKGTYFVPTFAFWEQQPAGKELLGNSILAERRKTLPPLVQAVATRAYKLGIRIVAGTDTRYDTPDITMANEALQLQKIGMTPMEIIQAMTYRSAQCLGVSSKTGAIRKGSEADIVVLGKDPLKELTGLRNVLLVVNDGKIVINRLQ